MPLLIGVTLYLQVTFAPLVDPRWMLAWLCLAWGDIAVWILAIAIGLWRRPSEAELNRFWTPLGRIFADIWTVAVMAGIWLFMPPADNELRLVVAVLAMTYVIILMLAGPETGHSGLSGIVGVLGALAAWFVFSGLPHGGILAFFLAWYGVAALILQRVIHGAVQQAKAGRAASEQALRVTAAERDARTNFIRAASHDLQQPIQAARLYFDQALEAARPAEREAAIGGAHSAFSSTQALLTAMLDHLRLEAGAMPVRLQTVAVADLLQRAVQAHAPAASAAGMRLKACASRLCVEADPELAVRALSNLVGNAIKHARGERILLAARRRAGGMVDLWVLDDGEGVDPSVEALFEDFSQGQGAAGIGFGLGLSSVRRIAELMGGLAGHEPRWLSGAAFYIRLPEASCGSV